MPSGQANCYHSLLTFNRNRNRPMESAEQQLDRCLETLRQAGPYGPVEDLLWADMSALLANDAIAQLLIAHIARLDDEAIDEADAEKALLECLLDAARRAREDDRPSGQDFLAAAEAALDALDRGATAASGTIALGSIYHRAGLAVPTGVQSLQAGHFATEEGAGLDDPAAIAANLADSIMDMREQCGGEPFGVYLMLGDSLAALPDEGCEALIPEIARWDGLFWQQLVLYWLLDPRFALRRAAAGAMRQLAESGRIEDEVAGRLSWLRHLLLPDAALQAVDAALAAYRKRHRGWPQPQASGALDQARASIPDGVGAQYLALGRYGESGYNWSMVLIKSGYGVRDAYVLADLDPAADQELWTTLADAVDLRPVSRATATAFLGAAVAENLHKGEVPAPGLIDVVVSSGLADLRPRSLSGHDWLGEYDPDQRLPNLSVQKRGRLINRSGRWHEELDVLAAWFENNSEARAILEREEPGKREERALREYLETRRAWWAELCLRSALVVQRDDTDELADSFAATGLALLEGREFKRIPLLASILETTITAHEKGGVPDELALADELPGLPFDDAEIGEEPSEPGVLFDPAQSRLQPLFDNEPVAGHWPGGYFGLHGYLFAIATHPQLMSPSQWIGPVFEALQSGGAGLNEQSDAQTVLTDMLNLYNGINEQVMDLKPALPQGCELRPEPIDNVGPDAPLGQWSLGFRHAREHFGHLVESEFDASDEMQEGIGLAIEMLEFFGNPDDTDGTDAARKDRLDQLAALACEYFYQNLRILCAVRASIHSDLEEGPGAVPGDPDRRPPGAGPFGDPFPDDYGYGGYPPIPGSSGSTKPKRPDPEKNKKKRKQQKKARKTNRKRK